MLRFLRANRTFPVHALGRFRVPMHFSRLSICLSRPKPDPTRYLYSFLLSFFRPNSLIFSLMQRSFPLPLSPLPRRSARRAKQNKKTRQGGRDERGKNMARHAKEFNEFWSLHIETIMRGCMPTARCYLVYVRLCGNTQMLREIEKRKTAISDRVNPN